MITHNYINISDKYPVNKKVHFSCIGLSIFNLLVYAFIFINKEYSLLFAKNNFNTILALLTLILSIISCLLIIYQPNKHILANLITNIMLTVLLLMLLLLKIDSDKWGTILYQTILMLICIIYMISERDNDAIFLMIISIIASIIFITYMLNIFKILMSKDSFQGNGIPIGEWPHNSNKTSEKSKQGDNNYFKGYIAQ